MGKNRPCLGKKRKREDMDPIERKRIRKIKKFDKKKKSKRKEKRELKKKELMKMAYSQSGPGLDKLLEEQKEERRKKKNKPESLKKSKSKQIVKQKRIKQKRDLNSPPFIPSKRR